MFQFLRSLCVVSCSKLHLVGNSKRSFLDFLKAKQMRRFFVLKFKSLIQYQAYASFWSYFKECRKKKYFFKCLVTKRLFFFYVLWKITFFQNQRGPIAMKFFVILYRVLTRTVFEYFYLPVSLS